MSNYLSFIPADQHSHFINVLIKDKMIGELYQEIDGYYVFEPLSAKGFWSAWWMREIADHLDHLNDAWDKEVRAALNSKVELEPYVPTEKNLTNTAMPTRNV